MTKKQREAQERALAAAKESGEETTEEVAAEETTEETAAPGLSKPAFLPGDVVVISKSDEDSTPVLIGRISIIEVLNNKATGTQEYRYHLDDPRVKSLVQGYPEKFLRSFDSL